LSPINYYELNSDHYTKIQIVHVLGDRLSQNVNTKVKTVVFSALTPRSLVDVYQAVGKYAVLQIMTSTMKMEPEPHRVCYGTPFFHTIMLFS
jgi:hypothetical protein